MKKLLFIILSTLLSLSVFAGGEIKVKFQATGSGMSISLSGVSGGKKQVNVYKTSSGNNNSGKYLTQFSVANGSGSANVNGVKCGEQVFVKVLQADRSDKPNDGVHWKSNVSRLRKNYSASNCGGGNNGGGDRGGNGSVDIVDSANIGLCGYGAKVYLKKKGYDKYIIAFNKAARSNCQKVYFESAGKEYKLSNGLDFTPSNTSLREARSYSGMKIKIYHKYQDYYPLETVYLHLR